MLFIYLWGAIFYLETIFRKLCTGKLIGPGLFYSLIFAAPIALLGYLICSAFKEHRRTKAGIVFLGVVTGIFLSQFIYFKIFRMFYSLYSATNAGQIFEFWQIIAIKVKNNFMGILWMMMPFLLLIILRNKIVDKKAFNFKRRSIVVGMMAGMQLVAMLSLSLGGRDAYSPYDLYFRHHYPVVAAEKMGLLTTLRLDAKRSIFNMSPTLSDEAAQEAVVITKSDEKVPNVEETLVTDTHEEKSYNMLEIDFDKLMGETDDETLKDMDNYFKSQKPTAKNAYTGKYKGYNLIQITAEGFSPYAIDEKLTPTLYKLAHEGYQFKNFYTPLWELSTSDGEYAICHSQIPKSGVWSMKESSNHALPFAMGNQLKALGYHTMAFHNHDYDFYDRQFSHPNLGYTYQAKGQGLDVTDTWPESDLEMMEMTVQRYVNQQPFHTYYMTVSGHMNYSFTENDMSKKNEALVADLDLSEEAKAYLASQIELDRAVENLLKQLEEAGVLENTLIALTPDHYPYGLNNEYISELAGHTVDEAFELYRSTFILWTPNMTPTVINKPCSSLDVLPTLSNLMGVDYDSRFFVGQDIFSDAEPLVILYSHNFITDKGKYNAMTKEFIANANANVDEAYVNKIINQVEKKFYYSAKILEEDYYSHILTGIDTKEK